MIQARYFFPALLLFVTEAHSDSSTLDAAIGGGLGGATGAAIGNELGGRDGAIVGGAIGAAVGAAIAADEDAERKASSPKVYYQYEAPKGGRPKGYHCPPGQRKKGRC